MVTALKPTTEVVPILLLISECLGGGGGMIKIPGKNDWQPTKEKGKHGFSGFSEASLEPPSSSMHCKTQPHVQNHHTYPTMTTIMRHAPLDILCNKEAHARAISEFTTGERVVLNSWWTHMPRLQYCRYTHAHMHTHAECAPDHYAGEQGTCSITWTNVIKTIIARRDPTCCHGGLQVLLSLRWHTEGLRLMLLLLGTMQSTTVVVQPRRGRRRRGNTIPRGVLNVHLFLGQYCFRIGQESVSLPRGQCICR